MSDLSVVNARCALEALAEDIRKKGHTDRAELAEVLTQTAELIERGYEVPVPAEVLRVAARFVTKGVNKRPALFERNEKRIFARTWFEFLREQGMTVDEAALRAGEQLGVSDETIKSWCYGRRGR